MSVPAQIIGKYQVIREIARSNDIVYEAYDSQMNRRVALKELVFQGGATDQQRAERIRRFKREAKAAGMLVHPNIVTIYDVGEDDGRYYIAMEYLEGETLRARIDRGFLEVDDALPIIKDVLEALKFAHQHSVVHRDIKPDNIHLLPDGRVKLTDFGIARLTFEPSITVDGQIFGTPSYMSPEQVIGKEIDIRSDLFSVGVVLYEMLTGSKPFFGDSVVTITYNIMNTEAPAPPGVSFPIEQIIRKLLEKSLSLRYQTVQEVLDDLHIAEQQLKQGVASGPMGTPYGLTGPVPPPDPYGVPPPNPYGAYQPHPYMPNPYAPPMPGQPPVGYPDPWMIPRAPRPPMMSAATKAFVGRFIATIVIGLALIGIILGVILGINKAYSNNQAQAIDEQLSKQAAEVEKIVKNAAALIQQGKYESAIEAYTSASSGYESLLRQAKTDNYTSVLTHNLAVCYINTAGLLYDLRRYTECQELLSRVILMEQRTPPLKLDTNDKAEAYSRRSVLYHSWFKLNQASPYLLDDAVEDMRSAIQFTKSSKEKEYRHNLGIILLDRGAIKQSAGDYDNARKDYQEARDVAPDDNSIADIARQRINYLLQPQNPSTPAQVP